MIVRIAGVNLPQNKRIEAALPYVFGVGLTKARCILTKAKIDLNKRTKDLSEEEVNLLRQLVEKEEKVEGDLRRDIASHIKRLKETGTYRGARHIKRLPARGQRTKTNSRTVRGNVRKTAASGKKIAQKT